MKAREQQKELVYCDGAGCEKYQAPYEGDEVDKENDEHWYERCTNCHELHSEHGMIESGYFNVYQVTRHCGGSEEGGWWYNWVHCELSIPCSRADAEKLFQAISKLEAYQNEGDIYSVLGGSDFYFYFERKPAQSASTEIPHYE